MSVTTSGIAHNIEKSSPVIEFGKYFAYQIKISKQTQLAIKGIKRPVSGGIAVANTGQVNFTTELNNVSQHFKFALTSKYVPNWNKAYDAVKKRDFNGLMYAFFPTLEFTAKGKRGIKIPGGEFIYQFGVDFKHLPFLMRGFYTPKTKFNVKKKLVVTINMGPSLQGWLNIFHKCGGEALNSFLVGNRYMVLRNVSTFLASNGVALAGTTVAVSFGLFSLMALYAAHRGQKGVLAGMEATYFSAYYRKITLAGEITGLRKKAEDLKKDYINENRALRDKMVDAGIADAITDAKNYLKRANIKNANPNDLIILMTIWLQALKKKHHASTEKAFQKALEKDLLPRAKKILKG